MSNLDIYISDIRSHSDQYRKLKLLSHKIVVFFLQYWLLIDMANGYLMKSGIFFPGGFSLGELSRIFFLIVLLLSFKISKNKSEFLLFIVPFILIFLSIFQYVAFGSNIVNSINISVKLSLPALIFLYIKENLSDDVNAITNIIKFNSFILIFNLIISLFGFGFFTYGERTGLNFGGKGYFFAGNEVGIVILVTYSLLNYLYKENIKVNLMITFIYLLISLVSLTRASIFGVVLVFIVSVMLFHKKYKNIILSMSGVVVTVMFYILRDYIMLAVNRAIYFIDNTSMIIFMTGGHKRWEATKDYYYSLLDSPLLLFTGSGWTGYSEQDIVDLISAFGISGISIYLIWLYFASYAIKNQDGKSDKLYLTFIFILVFGVATLAGHVMTSAMLAPFVAILANLHLLNNYKQPKKYLMQNKYLVANKSV